MGALRAGWVVGLLPALVLAPHAAAARGRSRPGRPSCDSSRYGCAGQRPRDYDKRVRIIHRPARGQDRRCLARLRRAGVRFRMLDRVKGVRTPVEVLSKKIGGVRYRRTWNNKRRFILDCHMVEVLAVLGRRIRRAGIATIYFSSSWRYSLIRGSRRLSKHAFGRALDVTAVDGAFGYATVVRHYEQGVWGCGSRNRSAKAKAWRAFFCALRHRQAFATIFTPDTDRAHRDHLHIEGPNPALSWQPRAKRRRPRRR